MEGVPESEGRGATCTKPNPSELEVKYLNVFFFSESNSAALMWRVTALQVSGYS